MKILVTGGAGYIGSILVPKLLALGHDVVVYDNFMYGQTPLLDCCHSERLDIVRADVRDEATLGPRIDKADAILPLACLTGMPLCKKDPITATAVNRDAVRFILRRKSRAQKLIFPCTNSGYGVGESGLFCTEETPMRPVSLYGVLKVEVEKEILDRGDCLTFRFATVFGASPRMRLDLLVNDFVYRAVNDRAVVLFEADFKRNYLHVQDAAGAFIFALGNYDRMVGQPYNVGLSEANLSKRELCEAIKRQVPDFHYVVSEIGKDPDQRNYIVSNERIEKKGFATTVGLDQGLRELLRCYKVILRNQFANV